MNSTRRKQLQKQLEKMSVELAKKGKRKLEPNRHSEEETGPDEDEQPLNEMEQAITSSRNRMDAIVLERVEAALKRLKDEPDDFGNCQDCGDAIPDGRLKAMPYAELCVDCQAKRDVPKAGPTRRTLTEFAD
jgi:DnaK suppressor protein